ncbi:hypothetical protein SNE40_019905 [Patella caerulea]|uniref:Uncharacterized protein n=1 Tax=Patella caerulea TaxID=87958 RepID=A0AAN8GJQ4_PATCE
MSKVKSKKVQIRKRKEHSSSLSDISSELSSFLGYSRQGVKPATKKHRVTKSSVHESSLDSRNTSLQKEMAASNVITNQMLMNQLKLNEITMENIKLDIVNTINERIRNLEKQISDITSENTKLKLQVDVITNQNNQLETELQDTKDVAALSLQKVNDLEQWTRRSSVRIYGLPDNQKESFTESINKSLDVFDKIGVQMPPEHIDIAHRLGPFKVGKCRGIIVKFMSRKDKLHVIKNRRNLKGSNITIREDLTRINAQLLHKTLNSPLVSQTWSIEGVIYAKLVNEKIIKVYQHTNIEKALDDNSAGFSNKSHTIPKSVQFEGNADLTQPKTNGMDESCYHDSTASQSQIEPNNISNPVFESTPRQAGQQSNNLTSYFTPIATTTTTRVQLT